MEDDNFVQDFLGVVSKRFIGFGYLMICFGTGLFVLSKTGNIWLGGASFTLPVMVVIEPKLRKWWFKK